MQRALFLTRRGLGLGLAPTSGSRGSTVASAALRRRGLASSSAASSDDGGVNAPASFSPEKMEKGTCFVGPSGLNVP